MTATAQILQADFTPIIRQTTSFDNGKPNSVQFLANINGLNGSVRAAEAIEKSAIFELYSVETKDNRDISVSNIDAKPLVTKHAEIGTSTFFPTANITIESLHWKDNLARTRVNGIFSVNIEINGLLTSGDAPDSAKWVNVYHEKTEYASGLLYSDGNESTTEGPPTVISKNGTSNYITDGTTQIRSSNLQALRGEEVISVYAQPDFGFKDPIQLSSEKIIVYPMTYGSLEGVDSTTIYQTIPEITGSLTDIYPAANDSGASYSCDVICYAGVKQANLTTQFIENHSITSIPTHGFTEPASTPNQAIDTAKIRRFCGENGKGLYTVELIQRTMHGLDQLAFITFNYNPEININGNLFSN